MENISLETLKESPADYKVTCKIALKMEKAFQQISVQDTNFIGNSVSSKILDK